MYACEAASTPAIAATIPGSSPERVGCLRTYIIMIVYLIWLHGHGMTLYVHAYMVMDYLSDVIIFCVFLELSKVVDKWSHTGREVKHTIDKFTEGNTAYYTCVDRYLQSHKYEYTLLEIS